MLYSFKDRSAFNRRSQDKRQEGSYYEAYSDTEYTDSAEYREEGRLRRVPDVLPVCLQDILHRRQSDVRAS